MSENFPTVQVGRILVVTKFLVYDHQKMDDMIRIKVLTERFAFPRIRAPALIK